MPVIPEILDALTTAVIVLGVPWFAVTTYQIAHNLIAPVPQRRASDKE